MISKNDMITFCKELTAQHYLRAERVKAQGADKYKYKSLIDLSNKYRAITAFLQEPNITDIDIDILEVRDVPSEVRERQRVINELFERLISAEGEYADILKSAIRDLESINAKALAESMED